MGNRVDFAGWIARWDAQQERYIPDREDRFRVMFDVLEGAMGTGPMTVIDLGCGTGSLAVRLLDRFPAARVIGVDIDPVLLALARGAHGDRPNLELVRADLRSPGWAGALGLSTPVDAALSTTALHWLRRDEIERLYGDLAELLRPGGVFLDGDHRVFPKHQPRLAAIAERVRGRLSDRRTEGTEGEGWEEWWEAVLAEPELIEASAARERLGHVHHDRARLSDDEHGALLQAAGFAEAGPLWQYGDNRILAALR